MLNINILLIIIISISIGINILLFLKMQRQTKKTSLLLDEKKDLSTQNLLLENNLSVLKEQNLIELTHIQDIHKKELDILNEQNKFLSLQFDELKDNKELMVNQFKALSEEIIDKQSSKNLNSIINPFKEELGDFKNQVNSFYKSDLEDRSMLKQELKSLKELNLTITEETKNLTQALKGENKTMGNWGEMILEKVLETSGLRIDKEFKREVSLKNEEGIVFRPDAIVHLPNERDVIIDAKTSLVAYERFIATGEEEDLDEHIASIESHIKKLSDKKYTQLKGVNSLDFIFMFIPIESSLTIALEYKPELFNMAYKNNIFLVSPSSLMIGLRSIENTWKHKKQEDNVKKIVNKAGSLYDKFVGFVTDIEKVSDQLQTTTKSLDLAKNKLYEGKGNLITQIEQLKDMGANSSKSLK